jgi:segregation and condensation protein B
MTDRAEMEAALEAVLFVATQPLPRARLLEIFDEGDREAAVEALEAVVERYRDAAARGVVVEQVAGGLRLVTRPDLSGYLVRLFEASGRNRLSMAALETLAIVAYRQPITAPEIQELRGVNSKSALSTLLDHRLVKLAGRRPVVGNPFLYRTTGEFLALFGLDALDDLPPLEEFEEALGLDAAPHAAAPGQAEWEEEGATGRGEDGVVDREEGGVAERGSEVAVAPEAR